MKKIYNIICLLIYFHYVLQYMKNKSYCEDLTEGKFSFPMIHAIKSYPEDKRILRILLHCAYSFLHREYVSSKQHFISTVNIIVMKFPYSYIPFT